MNQSTQIFLRYIQFKRLCAAYQMYNCYNSFAEYRADWLRLMGE